MQKHLLEIEQQFSLHYRELLDRQRSVIADLEKYPFDLGLSEMTEAIVERMYAFWHFNAQNNKHLIGRAVNSEASDFFTETCLLYLKCYFKSIGNGYTVASEVRIDTDGGRKSIKPDISIWHGKRLAGVVELKVSDGWKGKWIVPHLNERENQIKKHHPETFFGVLSFWKFSEKTDIGEIWGKQYFALRIWQKDYHHLPTGLGIEDVIKAFWKTETHLRSALK